MEGQINGVRLSSQVTLSASSGIPLQKSQNHSFLLVILIYSCDSTGHAVTFEGAIVEEMKGSPFNSIHSCLMYVYLLLKHDLEVAGVSANQRNILCSTVYFVP